MSIFNDDSDLAQIREERMAQVMAKMEDEKNDAVKVSIIKRSIDEVKDQLSKVIIDRVNGEITIDNLDEIRLFLRKELTRFAEPLFKQLKEFKVSNEKIEQLKEDIELKSKVAFDESFQTIIVRKPKERFLIDNIDEITFPSDISVNNLRELKDYFENLSNVIKTTFNIDIPEPKVTVNVPDQQAPVVNIDPVDLKPLLKALDPLKLLSNKASKPISVRLSDGQKFIQALKAITDKQNQMVTAFTSPAGLTQDEFKATVRNIEDILQNYKIADKDDDGTPNYYGFTDKDGNWYILKEVVNPGADTFRYASGGSGYTNNWTNRASLTYDYFYNVF